MIVLDVTIVGVALPSIREDLGFSQSSLAWVANVYMLTFGGFLLLAGRLGDLFGHRRLFLIGIALFTLASLGAGLAASQAQLVGFRAVQGSRRRHRFGSRTLADRHPLHRAGGAGEGDGRLRFRRRGRRNIGVLLGGILTDALSWHWIFLVNVPIGAAVLVLARLVLPGAQVAPASRRLDIAGTATVTASLMLAVYAIVNGNQAGWASGRTLGLLAAAGVLLGAFLAAVWLCGGAHELADRAGERFWPVAHDQRVAVGDLDELRVRQDADKPAAVLGALDAVFGCPDHQHRAAERRQARADLEHLAAAGPARVTREVAPHARVGL
jgi:hypothetical protein